MSGTSMDGVDIAVIESDGTRVTDFGPTAYRAYTADERAVIAAAMGCWPDEPGVAEAAGVVERAHLEAMAGIKDVIALGFHGQTLAHDPNQARTMCAGGWWLNSSRRVSFFPWLPEEWAFSWPWPP